MNPDKLPISKEEQTPEKTKKPKRRRASIPETVAFLGALAAGVFAHEQGVKAESTEAPGERETNKPVDTTDAGAAKAEQATEQAQSQELFSPKNVDLAARIAAIMDLDTAGPLIEQETRIAEEKEYQLKKHESFRKGWQVQWGFNEKGEEQYFTFNTADIEMYGRVGLEFLNRHPDPKDWTEQEMAHFIANLNKMREKIKEITDFTEKASHMSPEEAKNYTKNYASIMRTINAWQKYAIKRQRNLEKQFRGLGFPLEALNDQGESELPITTEARALNGIDIKTILAIRKDLVKKNPWIINKNTTTEQYEQAIDDIVKNNKGYIDGIPEEDRVLIATMLDQAIKNNPNAKETDLLTGLPPQPPTERDNITAEFDKEIERIEKEKEEQAPALPFVGQFLSFDDPAFEDLDMNELYTETALTKMAQEHPSMKLADAICDKYGQFLQDPSTQTPEALENFKKIIKESGATILDDLAKDMEKTFGVDPENFLASQAKTDLFVKNTIAHLDKDKRTEFFRIINNYKIIEGLTEAFAK